MNKFREVSVLLFVLLLAACQSYGSPSICGAACKCKFVRIDCSYSRSVTELPDLSDFDFTSIRIRYSNVKRLNCTTLGHKLQTLDITGANIPQADICRFASECSRVRLIPSNSVANCADQRGSVQPATVVNQRGSVRPVSYVNQKGSVRPVSNVNQRGSVQPVSNVNQEGSARPVSSVNQEGSTRPVTNVNQRSSTRPASNTATDTNSPNPVTVTAARSHVSTILSAVGLVLGLIFSVGSCVVYRYRYNKLKINFKRQIKDTLGEQWREIQETQMGDRRRAEARARVSSPPLPPRHGVVTLHVQSESASHTPAVSAQELEEQWQDAPLAPQIVQASLL